jgi:ribosomal protein S21
LSTVQVFNGNIDQALLSLKKKLQREQVFLRLKQRMYFTTENKKGIMKLLERSRRMAKKKNGKSEY